MLDKDDPNLSLRRITRGEADPAHGTMTLSSRGAARAGEARSRLWYGTHTARVEVSVLRPDLLRPRCCGILGRVWGARFDLVCVSAGHSPADERRYVE